MFSIHIFHPNPPTALLNISLEYGALFKYIFDLHAWLG